MSGEAIRVDGLRQFHRDLAKVSDALPARLKAAAREAAEGVAQTARTLVPVGRANDPRRGHPGLLRQTIRTGATNKSATIKAGTRRAPYAGLIHFGWYRRGIAPQPFMYSALDRRRDEVLTRFVEQVERLLDDEGMA